MSRSSKSVLLYEESRRTLNQQIERSEQITDRAHKLLRVYILAISAFGAILSAYLSTSGSTLPSLKSLLGSADKVGLAMASLLFGIFTLLFALLALSLSISESAITRGPGSSDIRNLAIDQRDEASTRNVLLHSGYLRWIKELSDKNHKRQQMLKYAYMLSVFATFMFFVFTLEVL